MSTEALTPPPFDLSQTQRSVFEALLDAKSRYGASKTILEDSQKTSLTYTDLIRGAFALGRKIAAITAPGEHVGIMLPSSET
jgi:acyl-[acyl-carrier-protein]-phospholipid O-acyltransferase/long-chain-fatty-acid--[acyl-carrier-protein] ligase